MKQSLGKLERERQFHNERFSHAEDPRSGLNKWYDGVRHGHELQHSLVLQYAVGKDVLEYGCSDGALSVAELELPKQCRTLTGIDISDVAIATANARCESANLTNARFMAMDAETMTFPDRSFDLVFGRAILHHLDLAKCLPEIARVLRPGGVAIFTEPLGHNPVLNAVRNRTPDIRTPDEHPFLKTDIELARRYFGSVNVKYYGLFSVASVIVDATAKRLPYKIGKAIDDILLRFPFVGRYAWYCLLVASVDHEDALSNHKLLAHA